MTGRWFAYGFVLALCALAGCSGPSEAECRMACSDAAASCNGLNVADCERGCADDFSDDDLSCIKKADSCDAFLGCHHRGVCERVCGDAVEKCPEFAQGCSAECREVWTHETALCVDGAVNCGDLFLCVTF